MIFVDTSVWIAALRRADPNVRRRLDELLDADEVALAAPVRVELLAGAGRRTLSHLRELLSALPTHYPTSSTWALVDTWVDVGTNGGQQLGFADLLIGAIAAEHAGQIWSLDQDFARLRKLKLVETYHVQ